MFVFDQREAHVRVAIFTEADARRDRNLGLFHQLLREFKRTHRLERLGDLGPDEHRRLRLFDFPASRIESIAQHIAAVFVHIANFGDAVLRAFQRGDRGDLDRREHRSEEHTSELQSLMRISYAVFSLKKKKKKQKKNKSEESKNTK